MRQILASAMFLALTFPLLADEKDDAVKKLNGTYEVISVLKDGKPEKAKKEKETVIIKDGVIEIKEGDKNKDDNAKFTVDASKKPAHIDIKPEKDKGETLKGIYELKETDKGVELTIAIGFDERPKDFKGEGKESMIIKLFRKKEK